MVGQDAESFGITSVPLLGELTRAADVGISSTNKAMWSACDGCGFERWVIMRGGKPKSRWCRVCAGRRVGRQDQCFAETYCEFCLDPFTQVRLNQRFCSHDCQHVSWVKEHPELRSGYNRGWYERNKDSQAEYQRQYRLDNRERLIIKTQVRRARVQGNGGSFSLAEWQELCARYDHRCLACGAAGAKLSVDHVVPVSLGGSSDIDNIQPLCLPCNLRKGVQIIDYRTVTHAGI